MTHRTLAPSVQARPAGAAFARMGALVALAWLLGAQGPAPSATTASPSPPIAAPAPATVAKLPTAIDPRYSHLKPGAARRKTCSAQYRANKADGGNAGLKWHAFYKACNTKLKAL